MSIRLFRRIRLNSKPNSIKIDYTNRDISGTEVLLSYTPAALNLRSSALKVKSNPLLYILIDNHNMLLILSMRHLSNLYN